MSQIDVIIPNWNGQEWLGACLVSLRQQTFADFGVIVVDNGSSDGSAEFVRTNFKEVQLVELPENRGFTGGINAGIQASTAKYICWFNNDAEADPAFLEQLLKALKAREAAGFGMAAARVLFKATPGVINSAGSFVGPDGIGRDRGFQQPDGPDFEQPMELFGPAGVAALYRRSIFDEVGLLDDYFFLYSEDVDLNFRAQLAGYRCIYVPGAKVLHRGSATARRISSKAARLASRNGLVTIIKNLPTPLLVRLAPWIVIGQLYQLVLFARQGNLLPALQGKFDFCKSLSATLVKRRAIGQGRKVSVARFKEQMALGRATPRLLRVALKRP